MFHTCYYSFESYYHTSTYRNHKYTLEPSQKKLFLLPSGSCRENRVYRLFRLLDHFGSCRALGDLFEPALDGSTRWTGIIVGQGGPRSGSLGKDIATILSFHIVIAMDMHARVCCTHHIYIHFPIIKKHEDNAREYAGM
jgi:hypothetical protein